MERQLNTILDGSLITSLPVMVNFNDVRNLIRFLKKKAKGISVVEINDIFLRRLLDPSKIMAYEEWGIIRNENNIIYLSSLGSELAKYSDSEARIYQEILRKIDPYHKAIEWIFEENKTLVIYLEIVELWKKEYPNLKINLDETIDENLVISFFNLCHYSELGVVTIGRKSHLTRLNIDFDEIRNYLSHKSPDFYERNQFSNGHQYGNGFSKIKYSEITNNSTEIGQTKIYLSIDEGSNILSSIESLLEITGVQSNVVFRTGKETSLLTQTHQAMKNCTAAIIVADERNQTICGGRSRITDQLLTELVATYTLFNGKVLLLWCGRTCPDLPIERLNVIYLKSNSLDWERGIKIGQLIWNFKTQNQ